VAQTREAGALVDLASTCGIINLINVPQSKRYSLFVTAPRRGIRRGGDKGVTPVINYGTRWR